MLSAVSMAFSSVQVTMMERIVTPFFSRRRTVPLRTSRPTQRCASLTEWICAENFGTKRRVMLRTSDRAGMMRPKR